jgi:hypothetical protein
MTDSDRVEAAELRPSLAVGGRLKRRMVLAWGLWDWGSSAYSAVITSFVFGPYVVRGVVGDARTGRAQCEYLARHLDCSGWFSGRCHRADHGSTRGRRWTP